MKLEDNISEEESDLNLDDEEKDPSEDDDGLSAE